MIHFQRSADLIHTLGKFKKSGKRIGFVPTMGALHDGHLSLISEARKYCDIVVCSIFVNPTQFNQTQDLEYYPRPVSSDLRKLSSAGCDVAFLPSVDEMYHGNFTKKSTSDYGSYIHVLEGAFRPGHFDGVVTVVSKLFHLVSPDEVFFGQKDYQQCLVVKELISKEFSNIIFHMCPVLRESDGLAMSSRNVRLSETERNLAPLIYQQLKEIAGAENSKKQWVIDHARKLLSEAPFQLEYLEVCDPETLVKQSDYSKQSVVLVALVLGNTRLIDNMKMPENWY